MMTGDRAPEAGDELQPGGEYPAPRSARTSSSLTSPWFLAQALLVLLSVVWWQLGSPLGVRGVWAWEVQPKPLAVEPLVRSVIFGLGIMGLCWLGQQRLRARRRSDAAIVAGFVALVFCLQLSLASLAPAASFVLVAGTAGPISTEYFATALTVSDPLAYCRDHAATMLQGHHHVATHPPGAVLFYWLCLRLYHSPLFPGEGFSRLTEWLIGAPRAAIAQAANLQPGVHLSPDAVGPALFCCLVLGWCAAVALVPLYHLGRTVAGRRVALLVCALFAVSLAPVLFFQGLDALLLLLALTALAWLALALTSGRSLPAIGAGTVLGAALFVSFGAMAAVVVALGVAILWAARAEPADRRAIVRAALALLGAWAAVVLAENLVCGLKLPVIFRQAMASHRQQTWVDFHRTYGTWVWLNVIEFACFLGLPVCVAVVGAARGWRRLSRVDLVGLTGAGVLALLDLSGSVRGEVGRVWLFLMPPLTLWAAYWLARHAPGKGFLAPVTVGLTLVQLLIFALALTPVVRPF